MKNNTTNKLFIELLMRKMEYLINKLLKMALHQRDISSGIYFDIFTYGGDMGPTYKYSNINSKQYISPVPLKIYFNGTVKYKNKFKEISI